MKDTAEESMDLKMALKHDPVTPELVAEAEAFPQEAEEAIREGGLGPCCAGVLGRAVSRGRMTASLSQQRRSAP